MLTAYKCNPDRSLIHLGHGKYGVVFSRYFCCVVFVLSRITLDICLYVTLSPANIFIQI